MGKTRCCKATIWRIGERRRRCSVCRRAWRIRLKKRGRPKLRLDDRLVERVLLGRRTLTELARGIGITRQALSYRFLRALELQLKRTRSPTPTAVGDLVLLIDGLWFRFKRRPWVLYLMAFKPPQVESAAFIDPVLQEGPESRAGWIRALRTIPTKSRPRIRALVCDNFAGSSTLANRNRWILQLCHFHLKASIRRRLGRFHRFTVGVRSTREEAYALVETALTTTEVDRLLAAKNRLSEIAQSGSLPWKFSNILREFVRRLSNYRAYHNHEKLGLPRTTGSIESRGRMIRDLMRQARSVRTPKALRLWATNYVRLKPTIVCRSAVFYPK